MVMPGVPSGPFSPNKKGTHFEHLFVYFTNFSSGGGIRTLNLLLRRPTTSSLRVIVFMILKAFFIFPGCDFGAKTFSKLALYMHKMWVCATTL